MENKRDGKRKREEATVTHILNVEAINLYLYCLYFLSYLAVIQH